VVEDAAVVTDDRVLLTKDEIFLAVKFVAKFDYTFVEEEDFGKVVELVEKDDT
jgi:hypothetical protein